MANRKFIGHVRRLLPLAWLLGCGVLLPVWKVRAQAVEDAQTQFIHGDYAAVIATAQKELAADDYRNDWRQLLVKSLMTVGRYDEAYTNAVAGLNGYSPGVAARLLARETALFVNKPAEANRRLTELELLLQQRTPTYQDGAELVALGQALLLLGVEPRLVLENCFQRAEQMDPPAREAFLAAGQLALDKHDFKLAADAFRAGLKKFPDDPDMNWVSPRHLNRATAAKWRRPFRPRWRSIPGTFPHCCCWWII